MLRAILAGLMIVLSSTQLSLANDALPLLYSRTNLVILRNSLPPPLPWQKEGQAQNPGILFEVEVRDGLSLYRQRGWFNLSAPSDNTGTLMAFNVPGLYPVIRTTDYAPLDILMINRVGTILQILPDIRLSDIDQDILPSSPVLAFLFVKGGTCREWGINPGDRVEYKLFRKDPAILDAPEQLHKKAAPTVESDKPMVEEPAPTE